MGMNLQVSNGIYTGLAPNTQNPIIWSYDGLVYRCMYVSFGLDEYKLVTNHVNYLHKGLMWSFIHIHAIQLSSCIINQGVRAN